MKNQWMVLNNDGDAEEKESDGLDNDGDGVIDEQDGSEYGMCR